KLTIVVCFGLDWRNVTNRLQESPMVVPIDPRQRRHFHRRAARPAAPVNHLRLVQPVDGLSQGVVVGITDAAHRWLDSRFGQALGVTNTRVLTSAVRMRDETVPR